ncbi:MAG: DUF262 domain-containing protein [Lachnospiraceae bacterium]|nr:DUF262 domain-containing protein [Ruminococcus sp.]MCM1276970.1 DUF262 domain-containing protein [Lachnospiraceae bacterium]
MQTNDKSIRDLMAAIHTGRTKLPDFQRDWVWDDDRIRNLIASITCNFPIGTAMFLEYGNDSVRFKYREVKSAPKNEDVVPSELILDGQQRMTSIYSALYSTAPVETKNEKNQDILRFYYIDIEKALDPSCDRAEAVFSVPESRIVTSNFGRDIDLDLSDRTKEFEKKVFPLNIILNYPETQKWQNEYYKFYEHDPKISDEFTDFSTNVIIQTMEYKIPIITLGKETPKEAVCQVFENVNTGGVSLTVFELVTAVFAMDDFELRTDWEKRQKDYFSGSLLPIITATDFLTACTLLSSYKKGGTVSCKKKDVLNLTLDEYKLYADKLSEGFVEAEKFLGEERIFLRKDLPYSTQLIPLAVLCTLSRRGQSVQFHSYQK